MAKQGSKKRDSKLLRDKEPDRVPKRLWVPGVTRVIAVPTHREPWVLALPKALRDREVRLVEDDLEDLEVGRIDSTRGRHVDLLAMWRQEYDCHTSAKLNQKLRRSRLLTPSLFVHRKSRLCQHGAPFKNTGAHGG